MATIYDDFAKMLKEIRIKQEKLSYEPEEPWNIRSHIKMVCKRARKNSKPSPLMGLSDLVRKRMDDALVELEEYLEKRYADVEGLNSPEYRASLYFCMAYIAYFPWTYTGYTQPTSVCVMLFTAAKWIAKEIVNAGHEKEMRDIIAEENAESIGMMMIMPPPYIDPEFDEKTLIAIARIIMKRNRSERDKYREDRGRYERLLINNATAERRFNPDSKERDRYLRLIQLIPEESIRKAADELNRLGENTADVCLKDVAAMNIKLAEAERKIVEAIEIQNQRVDQYAQENEKRRLGANGSPNNALAMGPVMAPRMPVMDFIRNPDGPRTTKSYASFKLSPREAFQVETTFHPESLQQLGNRVFELANEAEEVNNDRCEFLFDRVRAMDMIDSPNRYENLTEQSLETIRDKVIIPDDPYELAFAFIWGLENDNMWTWAAGFGEIILSRIYHMSPWTIVERWKPSIERRISEYNAAKASEERLDIVEDDIMRAYNKSGQEVFRWTRTKKPEQEENEDCGYIEPDDPDGEEIDAGYMRNNIRIYDTDTDTCNSYEQLLYRETGFVLPCVNDYIRNVYKAFVKAGMHTDSATIMAYMSGAIHASRNKYSDIVSIAKENRNEEDRQGKEIEGLKNEIAEAEKRADKEREKLYAAEKRIRELEEELEARKTDSEIEHRELADLREMIFLIESGEEPETPEEEEAIEWPYTLRKNTAVFGGHETWTKAIIPMLKGNIRFIEKDAALHFDTKMIRKAESIWIQINAISHPAYFRIIDAAKLLHKQIHYFSNAGAANCARQIVEIDRV